MPSFGGAVPFVYLQLGAPPQVNKEQLKSRHRGDNELTIDHLTAAADRLAILRRNGILRDERQNTLKLTSSCEGKE